MDGWLLDPSVLFELLRPNPDSRVETWSYAQPRGSLFLSAATIAAIRHEGERQGTPELHTEIGIWLNETLRPWFAGRVLPMTEDIVFESMRLVDRRGAPTGRIGQVKLLLAATARVHALTVCASDAHAYLDAGVSAFNPWEHVSNPR